MGSASVSLCVYFLHILLSWRQFVSVRVVFVYFPLLLAIVCFVAGAIDCSEMLVDEMTYYARMCYEWLIKLTH